MSDVWNSLSRSRWDCKYHVVIVPKYSVSSVIGFIKGKSAVALARLNGKERNYAEENFWAKGYAVSTVGYDLESVKKYIRAQEDQNKSEIKAALSLRASFCPETDKNQI